MNDLVFCDCRDCFETALGNPGARCWDCARAGCTPESSILVFNSDYGLGAACKRPGVYGLATERTSA